MLLCDCFTHRCSRFKFLVGFLFIIGDSVGVNYFVFAIILCSSKLLPGDFFIITALTKASSLVNTLLQSMPQIILQFYNNQFATQWSYFQIFSVGFSTLSLLYTCVKLTYAIDKIKQYETVSNTKKESSPSNKKNVVVVTDLNQEEEVYNSNL